MPSLLTLPDVFSTSYRAALAGGVNERTRVTVIGDGPVDLLAVLSAKRLVRVGQRGRRRRADVDLELCGGPAGHAVAVWLCGCVQMWSKRPLAWWQRRVRIAVAPGMFQRMPDSFRR